MCSDLGQVPRVHAQEVGDECVFTTMMRAARASIDVWFTTYNAQSLHFIKPALYLVHYVRSFHASGTII